MEEPIRIKPEEVREKVSARKAILVCAYDDEEKFKNMHLEGAISYNQFTTMVPSLSRDQEIIFYCG